MNSVKNSFVYSEGKLKCDVAKPVKHMNIFVGGGHDAPAHEARR